MLHRSRGGGVAAGLSDLLIVGGGINGCGIARDAVGRGLSVVLAEKSDLASGTSSASTKLIHGGLRYLEHYEFRLVRESLIEREVLLRAAPHIIWPLRFILPHHAGLRPSWLLRLGLFLYDNIGGRDLLPGTSTVELGDGPLKPTFRQGFEYSDCWVEDSRLVVLNAIDAAERGADIRVRTEVTAVRRNGRVWEAVLEDRQTGTSSEVRARALINAAGPWAGQFLSDVVGGGRRPAVRLVKGSHIIVPKLYAHDRCYIFQNPDGRIVFAIPYEHDFTLVGTTDVDYRGDPAAAAISEEEKTYLCGAVSEYFREPVKPAQIFHSYAGVRPLYDDGASEAKKLTRDYVLDLDGGRDQAPLLNIFGGKITTFRRLAEAALEKLGAHLGIALGPWTAEKPLPGGDFPVDGAARLADELRAECEGLTPAHSLRLVKAYGTRARRLLDGARRPDDLGERLGGDLYEREVQYLIANEWARSAEDVLWRRSKLGLHLAPDEQKRVAAWFEARSGKDARKARNMGSVHR